MRSSRSSDAPAGRVLTAELEWLPVQGITPGARLVTFDEGAPFSRTSPPLLDGCRRRDARAHHGPGAGRDVTRIDRCPTRPRVPGALCRQASDEVGRRRRPPAWPRGLLPRYLVTGSDLGGGLSRRSVRRRRQPALHGVHRQQRGVATQLGAESGPRLCPVRRRRVDRAGVRVTDAPASGRSVRSRSPRVAGRIRCDSSARSDHSACSVIRNCRGFGGRGACRPVNARP